MHVFIGLAMPALSRQLLFAVLLLAATVPNCAFGSNTTEGSPQLYDPFEGHGSRWVPRLARPGYAPLRRLLQFVPAVQHWEAMPADDNGTDVSQGVSVVIMNWRRPKNVRQIVNKYVTYDVVVEVLILMCREDTKFDYLHPKVRVIDAVRGNDELGLTVRFHYCRQAISPFVLIQDDDVYTTPEGIAYMAHMKAMYPNRLMGCCGRDWRGPRVVYDAYTSDVGPVRIILTIMMLADRDMCDAFFEYAPLMEDVARTGKPYWNGEDIMFSLVSYMRSHHLPMALSFRWAKMAQNHTGVHFMKHHLSYREKFLRTAVERLGLGMVPYKRSSSDSSSSSRRRHERSSSSLAAAGRAAVSALKKIVGPVKKLLRRRR